MKLLAGSMPEDYLLRARTLEVESNASFSETIIAHEIAVLDQSIGFFADERRQIQADRPTIVRVNWDGHNVMQSWQKVQWRFRKTSVSLTRSSILFCARKCDWKRSLPSFKIESTRPDSDRFVACTPCKYGSSKYIINDR
jgi:hypothetical protein